MELETEVQGPIANELGEFLKRLHAIDLVWFIGFDSKRLGVSREEIVEDFRQLYGDRFDQRAFDLSMIGGFVQLAAHIGLGFLGDDEVQHRAAAEDLAWWTHKTARSRTPGRLLVTPSNWFDVSR